MPLIIPSPRTGKVPQIHESVFIAPTAVIIGNVTIGEGSNIWFGAVLRGDWGTIIIGKNTSIQENVTIHNEVGSTVEIGDNCIVGHHAMVHGPCTIGNGCLVGIGANVLHRSKMGDGSIVGAAKIKKQLPRTGKLEGVKTSGVYADNGKLFKEFLKTNS